MQPSPFVPAWPTSHSNNKHPFLHQTMSVANFHDDRAWDWPRSTPSPSPSTASSSSSASRSLTPKSNNRNPWASSVSLCLPSVSDPPPCPTPPSLSRSVTPSTSRCATPTPPAAPQPRIPAKPLFMAMSSPPPMAVSPSDDKPNRPAETLYAPTPNPFRDGGLGYVNLAPLATAIITPALEKQYVHRDSPTLISRQGWERSTGQRAYTWALGNSKTALLFLMCDDIAAWRRASFYWLEDNKLPFTEADLEGIAANPKKVVDNQWRVLARELPQNGNHVELNPREMAPLQVVSQSPSSGGKVLEKVRWQGDDSPRIYVRKQFTVSRHAEKLSLLAKVQKFKSLEHPNVAKIICSYSQGSITAIITPQAPATLEDFLQHPLASTRPSLLLGWFNDLTQALAYIHANDLTHQSIRPTKILLDGQRIFFSTFGIYTEQSSSPRGSPPRSTLSPPPSPNTIRPLTESAYIYAAPEIVARSRSASQAQSFNHGQYTSSSSSPHRYRASADVFSLGCVALEMLSIVKGQTTSNFRSYRSHFSRDPSFHANLDRAASWRKHLAQLSSRASSAAAAAAAAVDGANVVGSAAGLNGVPGIAGGGGGGGATASASLENRKEDEAAEYQALGFVGAMMAPEGNRRPKSKQLALAMRRLDETRSVRRRRSFDGVRSAGTAGMGLAGGVPVPGGAEAAGSIAAAAAPLPRPVVAPLQSLGQGIGQGQVQSTRWRGSSAGTAGVDDGSTVRGSLISF
ncbi:uncharacterized protein J3D65DRAFT_280025 [Phyllosticta citribraziliensis]|uniref:Protein kinase domain-containing protein n=1 Tax=Phyllosticta citribraziliensis TaxID=989973 RepID=A0ABR1LXS2_9PEZI